MIGGIQHCAVAQPEPEVLNALRPVGKGLLDDRVKAAACEERDERQRQVLQLGASQMSAIHNTASSWFAEHRA